MDCYYDNVTGHVIFEMCTGREISTLTPSDRDYRDVRDSDVRKFLKFIFAQEEDEFIHGIDEVFSIALGQLFIGIAVYSRKSSTHMEMLYSHFLEHFYENSRSVILLTSLILCLQIIDHDFFGSISSFPGDGTEKVSLHFYKHIIQSQWLHIHSCRVRSLTYLKMHKFSSRK